MANGLNSNLRRGNPDQYQTAVDAFFRGRSSYWRDVYQNGENTLQPFLFRERRSVILAMVDRLGLPKRSSVLEVGCGAGLTAVALAKRGYVVEAVDPVEGMIDLARQAALEASVDDMVRTTRCGVLDMNFPAQHFDLAVAAGVIPWLDQPVKALWEINRVLKLGGHVILTSINTWSVNRIVDPLRFPCLRSIRWKVQDTLEWLNLVTRTAPRTHTYSINQIDEILIQTGFRKMQGTTRGFGPFTFLGCRVMPEPLGIKLHRRLQALADRQFPGIRSGGYEYAVMAVKASHL